MASIVLCTKHCANYFYDNWKDNKQLSMEAAFLQTKLGQTVEQMLQVNKEAGARFLLDLITLKIGNTMSNQSKELIGFEVCKVAKALLIENIQERQENKVGNCKDPLLSAINIYQAIVLLKPRLQLTVALFKSFAQAEEKLGATAKEDNLNKETHFTLDVRAITTALETLVPDPEKLLNDDLRSAWGSQVTTLYTYLIELNGTIAIQNKSEDQVETDLSIAWKMCQRVCLVKLYLDHVLPNNVLPLVKKTICDNLKFFWIALKDMDFTTSSKTFRFILKSMESIYNNAGELFYNVKGIQKCIICHEPIAKPVVLSCRHVGCKHCLQEYFFFLENPVCPLEGCKVVISKDFASECMAKAEEAIKKHSEFRTKLSQFFIDVLQTFVFVKEKPPHQEIIEILLCIVIQGIPPRDLSNLGTNNPALPYWIYIDPKPVIRSFILQLLFIYNFEFTVTHLEKILSKRESFVGNNIQFIDLCIMIVQCVEDSMLAIERKTCKGTGHQINMALLHMKSQIKKDGSTNLIKSLCNTARDRLAINTVALALVNLSTGDTNEASVADLLTIAIQFVDQHQERDNLQKYLVRYMVSMFQLKAIIEWKKKGFYLELLHITLKIAKNRNSPTDTQGLQNILNPNYKTTDDPAKILSLAQFWSPQDNITVEKIEGKVGGTKKLKEKCPFVAHLLREKDVLEQLIHLPNLIELNSFLIENYKMQFYKAESEQISIAEFVKRHVDQNDKRYITLLISLFLSVLKELKLKLRTFIW
jgi:hypothetical protein